MGRVSWPGAAEATLDRRTVLAAVAGLATTPAAMAQLSDEFGGGALRGAGSTFVHPLMAAWAHDYRAFRKGDHPGLRLAGGGLDDDAGGVALDYEAVGSQAGMARVRAAAVDFAASELPLGKGDLDRDRLLQVPLVAGAVVVAANIDLGPGRDLQLSGRLLADIYRGRIRNWADPAIAQLNPGVRLPGTAIVPLHRIDGSGTTFLFTQYLSQSSPDWKAAVGSDLLVKWPVGEGHKGNAGVARALERTPNALGFVGQGQLSRRLAVVRLQNPRGVFVAPTAAAVQDALARGPWNAATGFDATLVGIDGDNSYPIVATVFGLASRRDAGFRNRLTRAFFEWCLTQGASTAQRLGYVPLPTGAAQAAIAALRA